MYIKVSTGSSFGAAAQYNETGLSEAQQKQKAGQVRYLDGYNLLADDAPGIAAEMGAVASRSRTQQPVWNVSFSVGDGQALTDQQWLGVVERYMKEIGTSTDRHQVAVWRHSDTGRDHIHALINAVPTDGERALKRYQCGIRAKQAAQQIDTSLAQPIQQGVGIRDVIGQSIRTTLQKTKPTTFDELVADLKQVGISALITPNAAGGGGTSFKQGDHKPVKGSAMGLKFAELARQLDANRAEYQAEIERLKNDLEQKPAPVTIIRPSAAQQAEIKDLTEQRREAYEKRDQMRDAYLNKPATTVLKEVEVEKEVIKPDPNDQLQIKELTRQLTILQHAYEQQQTNVDKIGETVREVVEANKTLQEQNQQQQLVIEQQRLVIERQQRLHREQTQERVDKYNDLVGRFNTSLQTIRDLKAGAAISPAVRPVVETKETPAVSAPGPVASPAPAKTVTPSGAAAPLSAARIEAWRPGWEKYVARVELDRKMGGHQDTSWDLSRWATRREGQYQAGTNYGPDGLMKPKQATKQDPKEEAKTVVKTTPKQGRGMRP